MASQDYVSIFNSDQGAQYIIMYIFRYLPVSDLTSCCCVNKKLNRYLKNHLENFLIDKKDFIINYLASSSNYRFIYTVQGIRKTKIYTVNYDGIYPVGKIDKPQSGADKPYYSSSRYRKYCFFTEKFCLKYDILFSLEDKKFGVVAQSLVKIYLMRKIFKNQYINF